MDNGDCELQRVGVVVDWDIDVDGHRLGDRSVLIELPLVSLIISINFAAKLLSHIIFGVYTTGIDSGLINVHFGNVSVVLVS